MKGSLKVRFGVAATAVAAAAAGVVVQPASADTGTATIAGTGNFAIGLGLSGPAQNFTFDGQGAIATTNINAAGEIICGVAGYDNIGSVAQGQGTFNGNCDTSAGAVLVAGNFTRVGTFVTLTGNATGAVTGNFNGSCVFSPLPVVTTTPVSATVSAFAVSCQLAIS